ncbi:hypothetical protein GCM10010862_13570 [Devosia nitrariae]|uniref:Uncharacterized protein n=1 Tax=Devosia nitrariae TaxID=2071872 RepID=A0ABQ5W2X8_9HYPH|nr:hypothetical protein GCM10010862_13570 [Devosia nitrariae]
MCRPGAAARNRQLRPPDRVRRAACWSASHSKGIATGAAKRSRIFLVAFPNFTIAIHRLRTLVFVAVAFSNRESGVRFAGNVGFVAFWPGPLVRRAGRHMLEVHAGAGGSRLGGFLFRQFGHEGFGGDEERSDGRGVL